jgi:putative PIN family toxin of toxin-antitoxin system
MISIVPDKNIFISAYLRGGNPLRVLQAAHVGRIRMLTTEAILSELTEVLMRPKFQPDFEGRGVRIEDEIAALRTIMILITPTPIPTQATVDPEDQQFLECAVAGKADYIVSGDRHLLDLTTYQNIPILTPAQFLALLNPTATAPDQPPT